jgi:tetratricopeptide (TPR) repeat protein
VSGGRAIQLVEAGLWLRMSGDLEGARRLFEQALRLDPGCERARELLGTKPAAVEAMPEELLHVPNSSTNLFAVPLPRLFPEPPAPPLEAPEAPTDPFIPLSMLAPLPPTFTAQPPPSPPKPLPSMTAATPLPPPQRTPLPAAAPSVPRERTPLPGLPPPRGTPPPGSAPQASPAQKTPLPAAAPRRGTPLPALPPQSGAEGLILGAPSSVLVPEPVQRPAVAPAGSSSVSDDWWTDGVTTPTPPKDAWEVGRPRPTTLAPSEGAEGDALHMVAPLPASAGGTPLPAKMPSDPRREAQMLLHRATELQELDDHSGARELLQQAQALDPEAPEVARALGESEQTLQALYESKLGKLSIIPRVRLRDDEVIWLNLDHRAGFILAQIDGTLSFDDLFSVSGMSRLDTARILVELLEQRVIVR